jgi:glycosyltransferase involved in cell wall biosynthesis
MKILYVCHRFPYPPKRGGKIRPFNMIRHLHDQGHEVTVASLVRSEEEAAEGQGLAQHCTRFIHGRVHSASAWARMIALLPTTVPSSYGYFYSPSLKREIRRSIAESAYELIFVHCSSVAHYVADVTHVPKILDFGDMDSQKWLIYSKVRPWPLSMGYWLEGTKLQRDETALARKFDMCTCTTAAERATLDGYGTGATTDWFPNGVDTDYFHPTDTPYHRHPV